MVRVSSFNGLSGALLGLDLLPQPPALSPLLPEEPEVYAAEPLFAATRSLLGTVTERRFPIRPGQHLLCAYKELVIEGPARLYGAMAIAIPEDPRRDADLFMEDHGVLDTDCTKQCVAAELLGSVRQVGENLGVRYARVFLSVQERFVPSSLVGCVLTAAPYLKLARGAVPPAGASALGSLSVAGWESLVSDAFLDAPAGEGGLFMEPVLTGAVR
jgi:histidine decarboxylase